MNPRLQKIYDDIDKTKKKIVSYQTRLRELERQKTELENANILAMVRGIDVPPEEFAEFVRMFKERQDCAVPDLETQRTDNKPKEDSTVEK